MSKKQSAVVILAVSLVGAAWLSGLAKKEAVLLGLSTFELSLLGAGAGVLVRRNLL